MSLMDRGAQFREDVILDRLLGGKRGGVCVEVGANDGVHGSATLFFEENRDWRCILIEPNPELAARLRRDRPRAVVFECAVSDQTGHATLNIGEGVELAHGVSRLGNPAEARRHIERFGLRSRPVDVVVRTLDDLLNETQPGPIDFLTIDVEGLELEVLRGCDLNRWRPRILIVEDNEQFRDTRVRDHLARSGYAAVLRTGVNDWYARADDRQIATRRRRAGYILRKAADPLYRIAPTRQELRGLRGRCEYAAARVPFARQLYRGFRRFRSS